eukprot:m.28963 g.28963  ORF g.28963 m.28963 type:complete len:939 (-) comp9099_c0_seq1:3035-5851(-)
MRVLKPAWVTHNKQPIYSVDVSQDGRRLATGSQDGIKLWAMGPIRSERAEMTDQPKLLAILRDHTGSINVVRWCPTSNLLASGATDATIMLWEHEPDRSASVFGEDEQLVEAWKPVATLRGHGGDVTHLEWNARGRLIASASIDNNLIIWRATGERLKTLSGHAGHIKGLAWDPLDAYLATQGDDQHVRVWSTQSWTTVASVSEPFEKSSTHCHMFLRLDWSADGLYIIGTNARNNEVDVATCISRTTFTREQDLVGHSGPVIVARSNPCLFTSASASTADSTSSTPDPSSCYSCLALAGNEGTVSIWLTSSSRSLAVVHDLFDDITTDLSWNRKTGQEVIACSMDGTVAFLGFDPKELGRILTPKQTEQIRAKTKRQQQSTSASLNIPLSASQLNLSKKAGEGVPSTSSAATSDGSIQEPTASQNAPHRIQPSTLRAQASAVGSTAQAQREPLQAIDHSDRSDRLNALMRGATSSFDVPRTAPRQERLAASQPETRTRDGRRRITPNAIGTMSPARANSVASPVRSTSQAVASSGSTQSTLPQTVTAVAPTCVVLSDIDVPLDVTLPPVMKRADAATSALSCPIPSPNHQKQIVVVNGKVHVSKKTSLSEVSCIVTKHTPNLHNVVEWSALLDQPVVALLANEKRTVCACATGNIHVWDSATGCRLLPPICCGRGIAMMQFSGDVLLVMDRRAHLSAWDLAEEKALYTQLDVTPLRRDKKSTLCDLFYDKKQKLPVVYFQSQLGKAVAYGYHSKLQAWFQLTDGSSALSLISIYHNSLRDEVEEDAATDIGVPNAKRPHTLLSTLLARLPSSRTHTHLQTLQTLSAIPDEVQHAAALADLQTQLATAKSVGCVESFSTLLVQYARLLVDQKQHLQGVQLLCQHLKNEPPAHTNTTSPFRCQGANHPSLLQSVLQLCQSRPWLSALVAEYSIGADDIE